MSPDGHCLQSRYTIVLFINFWRTNQSAKKKFTTCINKALRMCIWRHGCWNYNTNRYCTCMHTPKYRRNQIFHVRMFVYNVHCTFIDSIGHTNSLWIFSVHIQKPFRAHIRIIILIRYSAELVFILYILASIET